MHLGGGHGVHSCLERRRLKAVAAATAVFSHLNDEPFTWRVDCAPWPHQVLLQVLISIVPAAHGESRVHTILLAIEVLQALSHLVSHVSQVCPRSRRCESSQAAAAQLCGSRATTQCHCLAKAPQQLGF